MTSDSVSTTQPQGARMAARLMRLVWSIVALVVLAGCGDGQSEEVSGEFSIYVHDSSPFSGGGSDALLEGTLVVRDGCVLLDSGEVRPVVWPMGTSIVDDDPLTLELRSGERLQEGQRVSGGGGSHAVNSEVVQVDIKAECFRGDRSAGGAVMVFNPDEELTIHD